MNHSEQPQNNLVINPLMFYFFILLAFLKGKFVQKISPRSFAGYQILASPLKNYFYLTAKVTYVLSLWLVTFLGLMSYAVVYKSNEIDESLSNNINNTEANHNSFKQTYLVIEAWHVMAHLLFAYHKLPNLKRRCFPKGTITKTDHTSAAEPRGRFEV